MRILCTCIYTMICYTTLEAIEGGRLDVWWVFSGLVKDEDGDDAIVLLFLCPNH